MKSPTAYIMFLLMAAALPWTMPGSDTSGAEHDLSGAMDTRALLPGMDFRSELADEEVSPTPPRWSVADWPRQKKVVMLNLAVTGGIAIYGAAFWDYGSNEFDTQDEGWFGSDTRYGGADKLGHAWSAYALASFYSRIYRDWGYSDEDASLGGALSSWVQTTLIEIGDGFSRSQGFSWQDEVMNTVGAGVAYLRHVLPAMKETVDFRMEWFPSPAFRHGEAVDPFTDYSGQKYLLVFKPDGFLKTGDPLLKALEFQIGYYTRGYCDGDEDYFDEPHRYGYVGIGLNMTYLLERFTGHRAWGVFDYYQIPYTYLPTKWEYE